MRGAMRISIQASMASSGRRASADCSTHAKKLKSNATGERKVQAGRTSGAAQAPLCARRREPSEPRIVGGEWSAARTHTRRCEKVERESQSLEEKSTGDVCGCGVGLMDIGGAAAVMVTSEMVQGVHGESKREGSGRRRLILPSREASDMARLLVRADWDMF